ncbi:MAG: type II secretion system protein GspG [Kiritimatiellales bacterium]|nr:type II secretion system protein GspG [Kiritimatiellales bacterium]MCF7863902.1 type II secretion system protein GspG [Kiritimatiellales bacterium]
MKKSAFTLIEIMIVVAIIGLLAGLSSLALRKGQKTAKINEATTRLQMMSAAILQLAWDTGRLPNGQLRTKAGSTEVWDLTRASAGLLSASSTYTEWKGPYIDEIGNDPWGNPYFFDPDYLIKGVNHIVVGSFGPNGQGQNLYDSDDIYVLLDD